MCNKIREATIQVSYKRNRISYRNDLKEWSVNLVQTLLLLILQTNIFHSIQRINVLGKYVCRNTGH
jgi:hypothetical protein